MKTKSSIIIALTAVTAFLSGCGSEEETRSMEHIYEEKGVPVTVEEIEPQEFEAELTYHAVLTGVEESSAFAMIADKVEKIYYEVGDRVNKDDVVISFPTDNPNAQYYQSKVSFENARATYNRYQSLYDSGGVARQDLDNAKTSYEVAKANWDAVKQFVKVRAPISGTVSKINIRESDNVHKDDELFTVSNIERMKSKIWVAEKDIIHFEEGMKVRADWHGKVLMGEVVQVDMSINSNRQAFGVMLEFDNPGVITKSGITAVVAVKVYTQSGSIVIERKNVLSEEKKKYVYILANGLAQKRYVTLGSSNGLDIEIIAGLKSGDVLITEGQLLLAEGKKIRIPENGNTYTDSGQDGK